MSEVPPRRRWLHRNLIILTPLLMMALSGCPYSHHRVDDTVHFNSIRKSDADAYLNALQNIQTTDKLLRLLPLPLFIYSKKGALIGTANTYAELESTVQLSYRILEKIKAQSNDMIYNDSGYCVADGLIWFSNVLTNEHPNIRKLHITTLTDPDSGISITFFKDGDWR